MSLPAPSCPECRARLPWLGIRDFFACQACGSPLLSNYSTCAVVAGVFCFVIYGATSLYLVAAYDVDARSAQWLGMLGAVVGLSIALPVVAVKLTIYRSPVRFRGVDALEARDSAPQVPRAAERLSTEQLARWQRGSESYTRHAGIGALLVVLGLLGLGAALFMAFKSYAAGAVALFLSLWAIFGGYGYNRKLARRHLTCPQCGRYPAGRQVPALRTLELENGMCIHCGTLLPLVP